MLIHMGLHTHAPLEKLRKKAGISIFKYIYYLPFLLLLAAGILSFARSSLWKNMLLLPKGNPYFETLSFYREHLLITLAFCQGTHLVMRLLQRRRRNKANTK